MRIINTAPVIKPKLNCTSKDTTLAREILLSKERQNNFLIEFHLQSILNLQQQNLNLSARSSTASNSNNISAVSILGKLPNQLPYSPYTSVHDRALKLLSKKALEEKLVRRRIESLWRSLPKY